jgi:hypothetical protein
MHAGSPCLVVYVRQCKWIGPLSPALQFYVHKWAHLKLMWFVAVSNTVLWFTYTKVSL